MWNTFYEPGSIATMRHRCNHGFVVFFSSSGRKEKDHTSYEDSPSAKKVLVLFYLLKTYKQLFIHRSIAKAKKWRLKGSLTQRRRGAMKNHLKTQ